MSLIPDIYGEVSSYLENPDLYSMMQTSSEVAPIASRYLRPEAKDNNALLMAVNRNDPATVRRLLRYPSVDPNARDSSAIILALLTNRTEVVRELLRDPRLDLSNDILSTILTGGFMIGDREVPPPNIDIVRMIFNDPRFDVNSIDAKWLFYGKYFDIIKELVLSPRLDDKKVESIFKRAVGYFNIDILEFMSGDTRISQEAYDRAYNELLVDLESSWTPERDKQRIMNTLEVLDSYPQRRYYQQ